MIYLNVSIKAFYGIKLGDREDKVISKFNAGIKSLERIDELIKDCNEASRTQVMDVLEFMSDATSIPIMIDADTGYGNFNNVRRLVQKLEKIHVAAMCIEDKLFPKMNSFENMVAWRASG